MINNYRHGDVNIQRVEELPKGFNFNTKHNKILAYGEATGHNHKILPKTKNDKVEIYENAQGELVVKINGTAVVTHQEHKTIEVPTGIYKINREREYDYWQMETRKVID